MRATYTLRKSLSLVIGFTRRESYSGARPLGEGIMSPSIAVAVVPEEYYRKPKGVQFRRSFRKRQDAIDYAEANVCRIVIACESGRRYDVLYDPGSVPGSTISFELVEDRGEMVAMPRLTPACDEPPEFRGAAASKSGDASLKLNLNSVYSWLIA